MTVLFHRSLFVIAAMVALFPPTAAGSDTPERPGSKAPPAQVASSAPDDGDMPWEVQLFVRGALAGLRSHGEFGASFRGEVDGTFRDSAIPTETTLGSGRETTWGAGVRALRGRWGLEVQHHRLAAEMFTPAGVLRETDFFDASSVPVPSPASDVFSAMALREFPLGDARRRLFVGAGAGYFLMGNHDSLQVFEVTQILHVGATMADTLGDPPGSFRMRSGDFQMDRGALLFGASVGLTLDLGALLVRPRLDVFAGGGPGSTEEMQMAFAFQDHQASGTMTVTTMARPRLLLFTVDVGWSFRP